MRSMFLKALIIGIIALGLFSGCATQSMTWDKKEELDLKRGCSVSVKASCEVPYSSLIYLQDDVQKKVKEIIAGSPDAQNAYKVEFTITRYDKGSEMKRVLIGNGQMYLEGIIEIKAGEPPVLIRNGILRMKSNLLGVRALGTSMKTDVLPKVGIEIANSIRNPNR